MDARNIQRSEINILSRIVHLVGLICEIIQGCTEKKTWNSVFNMEACRKSRGKAPHILILGTRWKCVVKFSSYPLYSREMTLVSTKVWAWWAPGLVWTFTKGKYEPSPYWITTIRAPNKAAEETFSQINPTRCTILFNIFIYVPSLHVSDIHVPIIRRKLLYLCDTCICHCVWLASGLLVGLIQPADQTPPIQSDKHKFRIDTVIFSWWWAHWCPKHVEKGNK